jgi:hypothetical protein
MAVLLVMKFTGITIDQYESVRKATNLEGNKPKGAVFHVCADTGDGLRIVDIWENQSDFDAFMTERLAAAMQEAGIEGVPDVEASTVHNIFAPAYE